MKKLNLRTLTLLILTLGLCNRSVLAVDPSSDRKTIEQHYKLMDDAAALVNLKSYTAYLAPDVVGIDDGETFTGAASFTKHLAEDFDATRKMYTFVSTIDQFTPTNNVVNVNLTTHMVCDMADNEGHYGVRGAVHRFDIRMKFHNEWKQWSGEWRIARFVTTGFYGTIDESPIPIHGQK